MDKWNKLYDFLAKKMDHHDARFGEALDTGNKDEITRHTTASSTYYMVKTIMNMMDEEEVEQR